MLIRRDAFTLVPSDFDEGEEPRVPFGDGWFGYGDGGGGSASVVLDDVD